MNMRPSGGRSKQLNAEKVRSNIKALVRRKKDQNTSLKFFKIAKSVQFAALKKL